MARLANGNTTSPTTACSTMSKKHVPGQKGTPFSRCVSAGCQAAERPGVVGGRVTVERIGTVSAAPSPSRCVARPAMHCLWPDAAARDVTISRHRRHASTIWSDRKWVVGAPTPDLKPHDLAVCGRLCASLTCRLRAAGRHRRARRRLTAGEKPSRPRSWPSRVIAGVVPWVDREIIAHGLCSRQILLERAEHIIGTGFA